MQIVPRKEASRFDSAAGLHAVGAAGAIEAGDRFPVRMRGGDGCVALPHDLWSEGFRIEPGEGFEAAEINAGFDPGANELVLRNLPGGSAGEVWLESAGESVFRLCRDARPVTASTSAIATEQGLRLEFDANDLNRLLAVDVPADREAFELAVQAARLATHTGYDRMLCLSGVRDMELLEHQIRTARTVLRRFRGRALLCDEVGLGKTIEAGLVLSELHMRGFARAVLILVPPSLIEQWRGELRRKFSLTFTTHDDEAFKALGAEAWRACDRIIASTHTAKREPHRSAIAARKWDLVIVDEAHHLRNRNTQLWRAVAELQKQFILLLTATPVQNNLEELFNLVTLLEPGLLSTQRQFQQRFIDKRDKLTPRNVDELHALLSEVMVRNRRSTVGLQFTRRWASTFRVALSADERKLYDDVSEFVRGELQDTDQKKPIARMALVALQMALGSSSRAAVGTLRKISEQSSLTAERRERLAALALSADQVAGCAKFDRLLKVLDDFPDKLVIFTQFRATQELLVQRLQQAGFETAEFHGGLSRLEKERAVERFQGTARLLVATEAGSEGRNLQFAHGVCNFDLPWNPMKIEQRIGRLSRIGQQHDVHVFNLVAADTVEAAVLHLLEAKLNLFEMVIGEIDMILGNLEDEREFPDVLTDLLAESASQDDFSRRMEQLGDRLLAAKEAYLRQRSHDDRLFGNRFSPDH